MKCNNCNKEIIDASQNYCNFCGESLNNNNDPVELTGEVNSGVTKEQLESAKEAIVKNKKMVGIIAGVIALIAVVIGIVTFMSGRPMSESKIKKDVIGQSVYIGGKSFTITDENLKDFKLVNRNTVKKASDTVELEFKLELEEADATIGYFVQYYYDKEWTYSSGYMSGVTSIDPKTKPEDEIEALLKESGLRIKNGGTVQGSLIKEISNIKVEGTDEKRTFTGDITLSNGVSSQKGSVEGDVEFNLNDFKWTVTTPYIVDVKGVEIESKIDEKMLKAIALDVVGGNVSGNGKVYNYKYLDGENERNTSFTLTKDIITDLTIKNPSYIEADNVIRMEIEGKAKGDVISDLSFSGVILLNSSFDKNILKESDVSITAISIEELKADKVKELILDKKISGTKINSDIAKTFVEEKRNSTEVVREYINGKITIDGTEVPVQVQAQVVLNGGKYAWKVSGIYKDDHYAVKKFE